MDSGVRRRLAQSLTPISTLPDRLRRWAEVSGVRVQAIAGCEVGDVTQMQDTVDSFEPDAIIHLAVQPSAPYSMRNNQTAQWTVENNVGATSAVLIAASRARVMPHVIHIGTMGVYGYGTVEGATIPEGYIEAEIDGVRQDILHPTAPGSLYHATKVMDQTLFAFFAKNNGLRITDLHQGIVWGTQTTETRSDIELINRFDYCGDFGTVLNRFLMQAAIGHPLTVHGTGGQTRAFTNINDSIKGLELALLSPPQAGERVRIMNQMTEVHRVRDLAAMVSKLTGAQVSFMDNPRKEAAENGLKVINAKLRELGLKPTLLADALTTETTDIALRFKDRADSTKIIADARWESAA
jgi:UDP-sulfoquinovose synthase